MLLDGLDMLWDGDGDFRANQGSDRFVEEDGITANVVVSSRGHECSERTRVMCSADQGEVTSSWEYFQLGGDMYPVGTKETGEGHKHALA